MNQTLNQGSFTLQNQAEAIADFCKTQFFLLRFSQTVEIWSSVERHLLRTHVPRIVGKTLRPIKCRINVPRFTYGCSAEFSGEFCRCNAH